MPIDLNQPNKCLVSEENRNEPLEGCLRCGVLSTVIMKAVRHISRDVDFNRRLIVVPNLILNVYF